MLALGESDSNKNYCTVIEPESSNKDILNVGKIDTVRLVGYVTNISEDWVITLKTKQGDVRYIEVSDNNEGGSPLTVGEKISVTCKIDNLNRSLSAKGDDILVYSVYEIK